MGSFSAAHWIIVALVVLVLFGPGKISQSMGEFGKGLRAFRKGVADDPAIEAKPDDTASVASQQPASDRAE